MLDACSCDYGDPPLFYRRSIRVARKPHRCEECSGAIQPGERYESVAAKWWRTDPVDTFSTCERCCDLRTWVMNNVPCFCWNHGNMLDDAEEAIQEARWRAPEETVGLTFGFLRRRASIRRHNEAARKAAAVPA